MSLTLPLAQAAQLITILIGGIVLAFGSLSVVLPARIPAKRIAVVYATGFSLMGGAGLSILLS